MENSVVRERVMMICLFYSRLYSNDVRRKNITQFYRELGITVGINANTIRQWGDVFDAHFDNGRKGYYQRSISEQNKQLNNVYQKFKDYPLDELERIVNSYIKDLKGNETNIVNIFGYKRRIYSIKTSDYEVANNILNRAQNLLTIKRLNWFRNELREEDLFFLVLGGDRKPWTNGLYAIGKIVKAPYDYGYEKNNFKMDVKIEVFLPEVLQSSYFYFYPNTRDVINIGPSTKGTPNQAINKVSGLGMESIIKGIIDRYPELEEDCLVLFGPENIPDDEKYIPKLETNVESTSKSIVDQLGYDFEGNEELIDFASIDDRTKLYLEDGYYGDFSSLTSNLIMLNQAEQKSISNITRDTVSIYDLYRRYKRCPDINENGVCEELGNSINLLETGLILNPDFQRDFVWGLDKKRQLIDSILLGIPLPIFYFSEDKNSNYLVVDGKQRLSTIFGFIENKFSLGNEYRFITSNSDSCQEVSFAELLPRIRNKIEDFKLMCYIVSSTTPDIIQNEIFVRVNRGGVPLNHQEIRNAIYVGLSTHLLNKITANEMQRIVPETRRKDQYLALRFFAFYLWKNNQGFNSYFNFDERYKSMDEFLSTTMRYINSASVIFSDMLYDLYFDSLMKSNKIFTYGKLRKFTRSNSNAVNMNIFEVWMLLMTYFDSSQIEENIEVFASYYIKMIDDDEFLENILYLRDNKDRIEFRINYVLEIKDKVLRMIGGSDVNNQYN